jgi:hypothetical protein
VVLAFCVFVLPRFAISKDMAFVCENTGSRKGHKATLWVIKTGEWYEQSALETFMKAKHPAALRHRWVSSRGDGYNIVGELVLRAHGAPSLMLTQEVIDFYTASVDDSEKRALYDRLSKGDYETTKAASEEVMRVWVAFTGNTN